MKSASPVQFIFKFYLEPLLHSMRLLTCTYLSADSRRDVIRKRGLEDLLADEADTLEAHQTVDTTAFTARSGRQAQCTLDHGSVTLRKESCDPCKRRSDLYVIKGADEEWKQVHMYHEGDVEPATVKDALVQALRKIPLNRLAMVTERVSPQVFSVTPPALHLS